MSLYTLKKAMLAPRTRYRRRRERTTDPLARSALELHYYRRPMYEFIEASTANRDLLYDFPVGADGVVVDAGAFVGDWTSRIAARTGARVYAFEPGPPFFRKLRERVAELPHVTPLPFALGARDGTGVLSLMDGPGATLFGGNDRRGAADVEVRDVDGVFGELGLAEIDLLKVNIEGGEYDLFDRLIETGWLPRIASVLVQFHEWHPASYRRRRAIRRALRRDHVEVWCYSWVWEHWRRRDHD